VAVAELEREFERGDGVVVAVEAGEGLSAKLEEEGVVKAAGNGLGQEFVNEAERAGVVPGIGNRVQRREVAVNEDACLRGGVSGAGGAGAGGRRDR
jgi:hypothetical protein